MQRSHLNNKLDALNIPPHKDNLLKDILTEAQHIEQHVFFWKKPLLAAASVMLLMMGAYLSLEQQSTNNHLLYAHSEFFILEAMPSETALDAHHLSELFYSL